MTISVILSLTKIVRAFKVNGQIEGCSFKLIQTENSGILTAETPTVFWCSRRRLFFDKLSSWSFHSSDAFCPRRLTHCSRWFRRFCWFSPFPILNFGGSAGLRSRRFFTRLKEKSSPPPNRSSSAGFSELYFSSVRAGGWRLRRLITPAFRFYSLIFCY